MSDKCLEKLGQLDTFLAAYMRDMTYTMHPSIQPLNRAPGKMIGRAYTTKGPDIYMETLESLRSLPEGAVYVHGDANEDEAVWAASYASIYGPPGGLAGVVIDGGIRGRKLAEESPTPTFARFVSPLGAINREAGLRQIPVVCGGVTVCPGDIVIGDADGVVVIPRHNEEEICHNLDGFVSGIGLFMEIIQQPGIVPTEHEALAEMFELKYKHPLNYWRYYEPWASKWREKHSK